jgi:hypothetical protein
MYVWNLDAYGCCHDMLWMLGVLMSLMHVIKIAYAPLVSSHILLLFLTKPFLSRMASGTRGQDGGNPPPPHEPSMAHVLRLMLEDHEAAHAERQANLATVQHLAQIATNNNNNNGGNGDDEP